MARQLRLPPACASALLLLLLLRGALAACPAAAPGASCVGGVETQCPVGYFCAGGALAPGATPCLTPGNCGVAGLAAEPPCAWNVSTLAGNGTTAFANGLGRAATFNYPRGVALDAGGLVYVADQSSNCIRVATPAGLVSTLAGSRTAAWADGAGIGAGFNNPAGVATFPGSGVLYVADTFNHRIRRLSPAGVVVTLAGSGTAAWADGQGTAASFNKPQGLCVDAAGAVFVADTSNNRIRKISPGGLVSTLAGAGGITFAEGAGTSATFNFPVGVAVGASGVVFVADAYNNRIRVVGPDGFVSTLAGGASAGVADGVGTLASFHGPRYLAQAANGNLFVADLVSHRIRMVTPLGQATTIAGSSTPGPLGDFADGLGTAALFNNPSGVAVSPAGSVYIGDGYNHRIRALTCMPLGFSTQSPSPSATPTAPAAGASGSRAPTVTGSATASSSPTGTPTPSTSPSDLRGASPSDTPTPTPSPSPSPSTQDSPTPSPTPSDLRGAPPSDSPAPAPASPSPSPSPSPSSTPPDPRGSSAPGVSPASSPGASPTASPSPSRSASPSAASAPLSAGAAAGAGAAAASLPAAPLALAIALPLAGAALLACLGIACWQRARQQSAPLGSAGPPAGTLRVAGRAQAKAAALGAAAAPPEGDLAFANPLSSASRREGGQLPLAAEGWTRHCDGEDVWYTNAAGESVWEQPPAAPAAAPARVQ